MKRFGRVIAAAGMTLGLASGAQAVTIGDLIPGAGQSASLPDINTSLILTSLSFVTSGTNGTLSLDESDPFLPFTYVDPFNVTTDITDPNQKIVINATFKRTGDTNADYGGTATGFLEIGGTPAAPIAGFTGAAGDPILTGTLVAVAPSATSIEMLWKVTGGRAAANYGLYAYTVLGPVGGVFEYDMTTGLGAFTRTSFTMDTTPGIVPLPPAGLALLAGIGALVALRRKRQAA